MSNRAALQQSQAVYPAGALHMIVFGGIGCFIGLVMFVESMQWSGDYTVMRVTSGLFAAVSIIGVVYAAIMLRRYLKATKAR